MRLDWSSPVGRRSRSPSWRHTSCSGPTEVPLVALAKFVTRRWRYRGAWSGRPSSDSSLAQVRERTAKLFRRCRPAPPCVPSSSDNLHCQRCPYIWRGLSRAIPGTRLAIGVFGSRCGVSRLFTLFVNAHVGVWTDRLVAVLPRERQERDKCRTY
jgi:hypothetical protein